MHYLASQVGNLIKILKNVPPLDQKSHFFNNLVPFWLIGRYVYNADGSGGIS